MQISSRFTVAVHVITAIDYFQDKETVTSNFLAGSVGVNPVSIRTVMTMLKDAGIISISQGKSGISLKLPLEEITFYDIYKAVDCVDEEGLFHFHAHPNTECPVGRSIHSALDERLKGIQSTLESQLRSITLADVAADVRKEIALAG